MGRNPHKADSQSAANQIRRIEARKHRRNMLTTGIVVAVIVIIVVAAAIALQSPSLIKPGAIAPNFNLPVVPPTGTTAKSITLSSMNGSVILLEFMNPLCPNCQLDAPVVENIFQNYNSSGVFVLAVCCVPISEGPGSYASTQSFIQQYGSKYTYVFDRALSVINSYGVDATPTYVVIDKTMKVAVTFVGRTSQDVLSNALNKALVP